MSQPRAKNYNQLYEKAVLSSFSNRELNFVKNSKNYLTSISSQGSMLSTADNFRFAKPVYDTQGNIVDFKVSQQLKGVDSSGKPTEETTNYILQQINNNPSGFIDKIKLPDNTEISAAEAEAIVRTKNGIVFYKKPAAGGTMEAGENNSLSFDDPMVNSYIRDNSNAREIIKLANDRVKTKIKLIEDGVLVRTIEEVGGADADQLGLEEVYVYAPGHPDEGDTFDIMPEELLNKKLEELGIKPGSPESTAVVKELDQIGSGNFTRDPKDGPMPRDANGKTIGAEPYIFVESFVPSNQKDKDGGVLYQVKSVVGTGKSVLQGVTASAIVAHFIHSKVDPTKSPNVSLVTKKIADIEHKLVDGHLGKGSLPIKNALMGVKTLYTILATATGKQNAYDNPVTQWCIYAFIHNAAQVLPRTPIAGRITKSPTVWGMALEFIWIVTEFAIKSAMASEEEKEQFEKRVEILRREARQRGCLEKRYIKTSGTRCIPCRTGPKWVPQQGNKPGYWAPIDPETTSDLPIDVKRDKNGNPIFGEYIYPKQPPIEQRGGSGGGGIISPSPQPNIGRNFYGPPTGQTNAGPLNNTIISQDDINPLNGEVTRLGFFIGTHNASKEAEYLGHITATYIGAKNADYMQNLMAVRDTSNPIGGTISSVNAGPIYSAASPSPQLSSISTAAAQNPAAELDRIRARDNALREKDKAWLSLLWAGGSTDGSGNGANGGGSVPPTKTPDQDKEPGGSGPETMGGPEIIVRGTFMLDMGFDVLYVVNGVGTIIPKSNRPTIQHGSDSVG